MPRRILSPPAWLLPVALLTTLVIPVLSHADSADDGADDEDTMTDDGAPQKQTKQGKAPAHFVLKPSERIGVRHFFDPNFSLDAFVRSQQEAMDDPLSTRKSELGGGLESAYRFGATTWFVTLESKEVYSRLYEHTKHNDTQLRTALQQEFRLGTSGFAIVPRVQVGNQWSTDSRRRRWKVEAITPLSYKVSDTFILLPFMPSLAYQQFTDRPDNRADWTMSLMTGARWFFTPSSFVEMDFGYENRWSNVHTAEFSRWKLTPQLNVRFLF